MDTIVEALRYHVVDVARHVVHDNVLSPTSETFVGFLAPQVAVLAVVGWMISRRGNTRSVAMFTRRAVLSRSTVVDLVLIAVGTAVTLLLAKMLLAARLVAWSRRSPLQPHVLSTVLGDHHVVVQLLTGMLIVVAADLGVYLAHRLMHRVPMLWAFHVVHHEAPTMTPLTAARVHPVESLVTTVVVGVVSGAMVGTWAVLCTSALYYPTILGASVYLVAFRALFASARHSSVPMSFGPFDRIFMSPSGHQLHHSRDAVDHNRNFATVLSLWDHLFGTYRAPGRNTIFEFGVAGRCGSGLRRALVEPFADAGRIMRARRSDLDVPPVLVDA